MAISQNFPNQLPALSLNFAGSKLLDPRITFTRSSSATYVDDDGLIKTASADVPRFEHNPVTGECLGLLVEESRTNVWLNSEAPQSWSQLSTSVTNNYTTSPAGTQTAGRIVFSGTTSTWDIVYQGTYTGTYVWSAWLKTEDGSSKTVYVTWGPPDANKRVTLNIDGTWRRYSALVTPNVENVHLGNHHTLTPAGWGAFAIHIWGAQLEAGSFASSYIPTSGSTVTRSQDFAQMTGSNFSSWYTATEGTLYTEYSFNGVNGFYNNPVVMLNNGTETYSILITASDAYGVVNHPSALGGVSFIGTVGGTTSPGVTYKSALAFKLDDFAFTLNGLTPVTDFAGPVPTVDRMYIGRRVTLDSSLHGPIKRLVYYPVKFTNSEIQSLTK